MNSWPTVAAAIKEHKARMESKIVCHHIGGRGFGVSFNAPERFWDDIVHVLYEADESNVADMQHNVEQPQRALLGKEFHIIPYCVGEFNRKAKLRITANPFASSLLEPNSQFFQYYCEVPVLPVFRDVTYHDMLNVVREAEVEVRSLDEIIKSAELPYNASPDFLSIDTQGYELPIMRGARHTILSNVIGMVVEIEIKEMYSHQPLLGDILEFLRDAGFHFAGFTYLQEISTFRGPIGFRGKGFPGFGDALFLRRLDEIGKMAPNVPERYLLLRKLAFIALNFGLTEYALDALLAAEETGHQAGASSRAYDQFLDEVLTAYRNAEPLYPRFLGVPEESQSSRSPFPSEKIVEDAASKGDEVKAATKTSLAQQLVARLQQLAQSDPRRIRHLVLSAPMTAVAKLLLHLTSSLPVEGEAQRMAETTSNEDNPTAEDSPAAAATAITEITHETAFERLLNDWGFTGVAGIVRARRVACEAAVRAEGPAPTDGPDFGPAAVARTCSG
jgi:FkbM family methyltransferase